MQEITIYVLQMKGMATILPPLTAICLDENHQIDEDSGRLIALRGPFEFVIQWMNRHDKIWWGASNNLKSESDIENIQMELWTRYN